MRPLSLAIASTVLAAQLALSPAGQAQPPSDSGPESPTDSASEPQTVVSVSVAGSAADADRLDAALRELLGRLGATLSLQRVDDIDHAASRPAISAVAWVGIDLTAADRAVVTVVAAAAGAPALWRVLERNGSRQILIEQTAHVVHTALESVLSAQPDRDPSPPPPAGPPPMEAPRPPVAPATQPAPPGPSPAPLPTRPPATDQPARARWGMDAAALLGGHGIADNAGVVFGAAAALAAGYRHGPWRLGGWLTAEYRVPFDIDDSEASPRAQAIALRSFPTIGLFQTRQVALELGVGGGIDIFTVDHRVEDAQGRGSSQSSTKLAPIVTTMLVLHLGVVDNVQFVTLAGIDIDPSRPQLEVRHDLPEQAKPWVVRPALMLGVSFTMVGTEPFE
jgi:hypothetical protein